MSQVMRRELFPGVWLRAVHTNKFKSAYLSITLLVPLERETAGAPPMGKGGFGYADSGGFGHTRGRGGALAGH